VKNKMWKLDRVGR